MKRICMPLIIMLTGLSFLHTESPKLTRVAMVTVTGGTFTMGSDDDEDYAKPTHKVTLSGFQMSTTEVTQALYQEVMGTNLSHFKGDNLAVESVSWYDAVEFCNKLSLLEGLSPAYTINKTNSDPNNYSDEDIAKWTVTLNAKSNGYRLPTEAQWEFAARGGTKSKYYVYAGSKNANEVGWHKDNSYGKTHEVATKTPNELGLYDMSGNVWEWCFDWYDQYNAIVQTNPVGASSGISRVFRGGNWSDYAWYLRVAIRMRDSPDFRYSGIGFRLVLPLSD